MRPSNKSRNRNKNNNRRGIAGNNINRVFDSAGPEGRVRGTPQQIIDKYISLTYDAQLSGDRVSAENFQQHAEHYSRLLIEAQKELADKQTEQNAALVNNKPVAKSIADASIPSEFSGTASAAKLGEQKVVNIAKNLEDIQTSDDLNKASVTPNKEPPVRKTTKKRVTQGSKPIVTQGSKPIEV